MLYFNRMHFTLIFLILINLFKLFIAKQFPLIGDEAFYWVWSQHLDLSYISHPPMIAYVNFILTTLLGNNEFAIRLGAISIVFLISLIIYHTAKELFDQTSATISVFVFNLLPTFFGGGMFLVPQTILFFFWSLSFYLIVIITKHQKASYWYFLGISAGLGLLSDYIMALFFIGTAIYLLINRKQRFWFFKKEPYLACLIAFFIFSPVIIWNLKQGFAPIFYWGGKMGIGARIVDNLLNFFGLQMLLYTPPIFFQTLYLILKEKELLPKIYTAAVFIPFLLVSPFVNVGGHWPATAYLPTILSSGRFKRPLLYLTFIFALLVNISGFIYYLFFYPTPTELKGKEFTINRELPQFLEEATSKTGRTFYIARDIGTFGLVSFHGKVKVYSPPGLSREMEVWGVPDLRKGDNVIYFARENTIELYAKLKPCFDKVKIEPHKRIFTKDADIPTKMEIFHCINFKGGKLP